MSISPAKADYTLEKVKGTTRRKPTWRRSAPPLIVTSGTTMTSDDLTTKQSQALQAKVGTMLAYLNRLRTRTEKRFPPDDRLRQLVADAYNSVHALNVELHYLTCRNVGRSPRRPDDQPQSHGD